MMENISTDTQCARASGCEIDYWLKIDEMDCALSGRSLQYVDNDDVSDHLGTGRNLINDILYRVRRKLTIGQCIMKDNAHAE